MKVRPIRNRVIIRRIEEERTTSTGIVLPDSAMVDEGCVRALVIAVGPGVYDKGNLIPPSVAEGDTVIVSRYGGVEVTIEGDDLVIVNDQDILAIVG